MLATGAANASARTTNVSARMAFQRIHTIEVERALTAAQLEAGMTSGEAHAAALAGKIPGVPVSAVPPRTTIARWGTEARRDRAAMAQRMTPEGVDATLETIAAAMGEELERRTRNLTRRKSKATAQEWIDVARAGKELAQLRRAMRPDGRPRGTAEPTADAPAAAASGGFLSDLAERA